MATSLNKASQRGALKVEVSERNDIRIVTLSGRLDQTFEEPLARTLEGLMLKNEVRVVINLEHLEFLNSRGVSAFIAAVDGLRLAGGDLKIAGATPQARLVLGRLGVDQILQQFETVDAAVEAFTVPIQEFLAQGGIDVFVAGARSRTFHASGCRKVKRLKSVKILASKKAAREAGLTACAQCCGA